MNIRQKTAVQTEPAEPCPRFVNVAVHRKYLVESMHEQIRCPYCEIERLQGEVKNAQLLATAVVRYLTEVGTAAEALKAAALLVPRKD